MTENTPKTKRVIDWEKIEIQYRAGVRSLKDIGDEFGVSDAGIIKKAKVCKWDRDLKAKIQAKADAKVSAALVSAEVSAERKVSEQVVIEAEAAVAARVMMAHRSVAQQSRNLLVSLLDEVVATTNNKELFEKLGELMASPDDKGRDKLSEIYHKVISLNGRVSNAKQIVDAVDTTIEIERKVLNIKDHATEPKPQWDLDLTKLTDEESQMFMGVLRKITNNGG